MPTDSPAPAPRAEPHTPRSPRVVLHVGAPKSGTTFLQDALWHNQDALRDVGVQCAGERQREMFLGAIELRGTHEFWGFRPEELEGTWHRLCQDARTFPGTTVMSHEALAAATDEQAAAALAELSGIERHVVFTARDLGRQVVSEWQERVKNGSTDTFERFGRAVGRGVRSGELDGSFWRFQNLPAILDRWAGDLPPSQVHVVVAPQPGAGQRELWERFAAAVGFDAAGLEPGGADGRSNQSLGVAQIALLRQVNKALDGRIPQPRYAWVVKRFLSQDVLTRHRSPRPVCPPELLAQLRELSEGWIHEIRERGYAVHGDLAELTPAEPDPGTPGPDEVDPRQQADVSAAAIADILVEVAELRGRVRRLSHQLEEATATSPSLPARARRRLGSLLNSVRRR